MPGGFFLLFIPSYSLAPLFLLVSSALAWLPPWAAVPQVVSVLVWVTHSHNTLGCSYPGVGCLGPESLWDVPPSAWRCSFHECLLPCPRQYPIPHTTSFIFLAPCMVLLMCPFVHPPVPSVPCGYWPFSSVSLSRSAMCSSDGWKSWQVVGYIISTRRFQLPPSETPAAPLLKPYLVSPAWVSVLYIVWLRFTSYSLGEKICILYSAAIIEHFNNEAFSEKMTHE